MIERGVESWKIRKANDAEVYEADMSEQARKVRHEAIPQWAEGLYYNKGLFSEALVYYDDEAIYFEVKGKDSGIVRFTFEMVESLKVVVEEENAASSE
jgi:hypothetical protein